MDCCVVYGEYMNQIRIVAYSVTIVGNRRAAKRGKSHSNTLSLSLFSLLTLDALLRLNSVYTLHQIRDIEIHLFMVYEYILYDGIYNNNP